jgi:L-iditol 2-dehydrogenase
MKALVFDLSIPKYLLSMATGKKFRSLQYGKLSCLQLRELAEPELPNQEWVKLAPLATGLCGSDMGAIFFKMSPSTTPFASMPAVLGHEILAQVTEVGSQAGSEIREGDRVVVDPVLNCETRATPACARCSHDVYGLCERHSDGDGAVLGFSKRYPGGFCEKIVAHRSQVFRVPDSVPNNAAVLSEPLSVCVHAVKMYPPDGAEQVLVIGGGIIALGTVWALKQLYPHCHVTILAMEPYQQQWAKELGADAVLGDNGQPIMSDAARITDTFALQPTLAPKFLAGGFDRVFDCIGSQQSMGDGLRLTGPRGTLVLVGAAGILPNLDLTQLWMKEISIKGSVYYGWENHQGKRQRTFAITRELLEQSGTKVQALVTHSVPLEQYAHAIEVNLDRRTHQSVKSVLIP